MAKIKVILEKGETIEDADKLLFKALDLHASGDSHDDEAFDDPAMEDTINELSKAHEKMYAEMLEEIGMVLDKEYTDKYNGNL